MGGEGGPAAGEGEGAAGEGGPAAGAGAGAGAGEGRGSSAWTRESARWRLRQGGAHCPLSPVRHLCLSQGPGPGLDVQLATSQGGGTQPNQQGFELRRTKWRTPPARMSRAATGANLTQRTRV